MCFERAGFFMYLFSTFRRECITVEWSRPPKWRPIVFKEESVSFFDRYIAMWRATATSFLLELLIIKSFEREK